MGDQGQPGRRPSLGGRWPRFCPPESPVSDWETAGTAPRGHSKVDEPRSELWDLATSSKYGALGPMDVDSFSRAERTSTMSNLQQALPELDSPMFDAYIEMRLQRAYDNLKGKMSGQNPTLARRQGILEIPRRVKNRKSEARVLQARGPIFAP